MRQICGLPLPVTSPLPDTITSLTMKTLASTHEQVSASIGSVNTTAYSAYLNNVMIGASTEKPPEPTPSNMPISAVTAASSNSLSNNDTEGSNNQKPPDLQSTSIINKPLGEQLHTPFNAKELLWKRRLF